jgi:hypothetical protein
LTSLKFTVNLPDLKKDFEEKIKKNLQKDLNQAVQQLGKGAYAYIKEKTQDLNKEEKEKYLNNLFLETVEDNIVVITLKEAASYIENGTKAGFMDYLLERKSGSDVKVSKKDNKKYRVIPFEHSVNKSAGENIASSETGEGVIRDVKTFLKKQGVSYSRTRNLEKNSDGSVRVGKISSFNIDTMGARKKHNIDKNIQNINVYQEMNPRTKQVERKIMTFRVISEKHKGTGKWEHPGRDGKKFFDDTIKWIEKSWNTEIFPEIQKKYRN